MAKVLIAFLLFLSGSSIAYAHPPSDIKITFDPEKKLITAEALHETSDPLRHYIKKVEIKLNGKEIIKQKISQQDNESSQTVFYIIPDAKGADVISVDASCRMTGKLKKKIKIEIKK
ncbi:MAG: hypothetical protein HY810_03965 [Candidatus Omnitrophica bacterium]|nr:hypothetical protein [Candidatus Omnitrophota bacterium]